MTTTPKPEWPAAFDQAAAARLLERFTALGRSEARLAARPDVAAMLRGLGGNSPYLSDLALREAGALVRFLADGPDATVAATMSDLAQGGPGGRRGRVTAALPPAKR